jgi:hypothetical protein
MSLSREQIWLLKAAQRQARIADDEYRDTLENLTHLPGCRSSKDPRLTDDHLDTFMSYFEAIYWRGADAGTIPPPISNKQPFRQRNFWSVKNRKGQTSRDRFADEQLNGKTAALEASLAALGCGPAYCAAIKRKTGPGWKYKAALERTLHFKRAAVTASATGGAIGMAEDQSEKDPF